MSLPSWWVCCCNLANMLVRYDVPDAQVGEYMDMRPRSQQSALRPFMAAEGEGGAPAQSDSGGASFLGQASRRPDRASQILCCAKHDP